MREDGKGIVKMSERFVLQVLSSEWFVFYIIHKRFAVMREFFSRFEKSPTSLMFFPDQTILTAKPTTTKKERIDLGWFWFYFIFFVFEEIWCVGLNLSHFRIFLRNIVREGKGHHHQKYSISSGCEVT